MVLFDFWMLEIGDWRLERLLGWYGVVVVVENIKNDNGGGVSGVWCFVCLFIVF